jgi:hypothetical protein
MVPVSFKQCVVEPELKPEPKFAAPAPGMYQECIKKNEE